MKNRLKNSLVKMFDILSNFSKQNRFSTKSFPESTSWDLTCAKPVASCTVQDDDSVTKTVSAYKRASRRKAPPKVVVDAPCGKNVSMPSKSRNHNTQKAGALPGANGKAVEYKSLNSDAKEVYRRKAISIMRADVRKFSLSFFRDNDCSQRLFADVVRTLAKSFSERSLTPKISQHYRVLPGKHNVSLVVSFINQMLKDSVIAEVDKHFPALASKKRKLVHCDDYGVVTGADAWNVELVYFIEKVVMPRLVKQFPCVLDIVQIRKYIDSYVSRKDKPQNKRVDVKSLSPTDYEKYCADVLNATGWRARTTKGSGDQGVDVVATKDGVRAVFQCKMHSKPIGNKAVQEAVSGKLFESASVAFVVSRTSFTRAAEELAVITGVHLIHDSQLQDLSKYLQKNWVKKNH